MSSRSQKVQLLLLIGAIVMSSCTGDGDDASDGTITSGSDKVWVGHYYSPPNPNHNTPTKYSIEVREDSTAVLELEDCFGGDPQSAEVAWSVLDDASIQFESQGAQKLEWFFVEKDGYVLMGETDDPEIVELSYEGFVAGPEVGPFRRGEGCLVVREPSLGCGEGSYVVKCSD